jgi:hypothetical protein
MTVNEYQCANCGVIQERTTSEEDMLAELKDRFGNFSAEECDILCEDCWQKFIKWWEEPE